MCFFNVPKGQTLIVVSCFGEKQRVSRPLAALSNRMEVTYLCFCLLRQSVTP